MDTYPSLPAGATSSYPAPLPDAFSSAGDKNESRHGSSRGCNACGSESARGTSPLAMATTKKAGEPESVVVEGRRYPPGSVAAWMRRRRGCASSSLNKRRAAPHLAASYLRVLARAPDSPWSGRRRYTVVLYRPPPRLYEPHLLENEEAPPGLVTERPKTPLGQVTSKLDFVCFSGLSSRGLRPWACIKEYTRRDRIQGLEA